MSEQLKISPDWIKSGIDQFFDDRFTITTFYLVKAMNSCTKFKVMSPKGLETGAYDYMVKVYGDALRKDNPAEINITNEESLFYTDLDFCDIQKIRHDFSELWQVLENGQGQIKQLRELLSGFLGKNAESQIWMLDDHVYQIDKFGDTKFLGILTQTVLKKPE